MRLSLFVAALSESQSDSKVRPHSSASISFAQTVLFNSFSFASSASNRAASSQLILPLTLIGSTGMEGSRLELAIHSPAAISRRTNTVAKKGLWNEALRQLRGSCGGNSRRQARVLRILDSQIASRAWPEDGGGFSLSPGERAGVRGKKMWPIQRAHV